MFVSMWMTPNPTTVEPTTLLTDVATLMARRQFRRVPVVAPGDGAPRLLGIVTASDILHAFPPELNPFSVAAADMLATQTLNAHRMPITASDIMTRDPLTITAEAPIEAAARLMRDHKVGALPVVRDGALHGLISESDIFRALVGIFETNAPGARITFDTSKGEDVFPLIAEIAQRRQLQIITFISLQKHDRPVCVVEVAGAAVDKMLDDVWKSHHRVVSVIRLP
ncbi:MAG: CBS domain-containing protein [Candidatus Obscuribacterales bacterium]|nr:CBS domain-containing protein [Steroidobacteraceae bacterium]